MTVLRLSPVAAPKPQRRGSVYTLVEMLVVITIIGLIMALVAPRVLPGYLSEIEGQGCQDTDRKLRQCARSFLSQFRALSDRLRRFGRIGSETRQCARLERSLPERRRRSSGSLGQRLRLPRARPTRRLRNSFISVGRAGRWNRHRKRYYELDQIKSASQAGFALHVVGMRPGHCRDAGRDRVAGYPAQHLAPAA